MSGSTRRPDIDQEHFNALLQWLDPDREKAAAKYEEIRSGLIKILAYRRVSDPDNLADIVINRVASKVGALREQKCLRERSNLTG